MRSPRRIPITCVLAALPFLLAATQACAAARNYDNPTGPIFTAVQTAPPRTASTLRIVTFNLRFGRQIERAAALLRRPGPLHDADVLVLQEVDNEGSARLAQALAMNYLYVPAAVHPVSHRDMGVALLTPWPLEDQHKLLLPREHRLRRMRRSAAVATIRSPIGPVRVYGLHLETPFGASDDDRRAQARAVLADLAEWAGPVAVAGDFNGKSGARELASAGFQWLTRNVHNTSWRFDFDHILVRGLCATASPPAARGPDARGISDHRPVWTVVQPCT
jgi:endonuclease/exonuclease/phosphatase family metal-dependent hydrolase